MELSLQSKKPSENPLWVALDHIPSFPRKRESSGRGLNTRDGTQSFQTASKTILTRHGLTVNRLNHGVDVAEAVRIGLIVALGIVVGARDVVGINAVAVAGVLEGL